MSVYPFYPTRRSELLDGVWDFAYLGPDVDLDLVKPAAIGYDERSTVPG